MPNEQIAREVSSVGAAAMWVESWLAPRALEASAASIEPPVRQNPEVEARLPAPRAAEREAPEPRIDSGRGTPAPARVSVLAMLQSGSDRSAWAGAELSAQVRVTRAAWLGAALGAARDTRFSGPAEDSGTSRQNFSASARGGLLVPAAQRLDLTLGVGVGITTGTAFRRIQGVGDDTGQGGGFGEALADFSWEVRPELALMAGVAARYRLLSAREHEDSFDARIPAVMPALSGELRVGAGFGFGASR